jgi:hypothetical protein
MNEIHVVRVKNGFIVYPGGMQERHVNALDKTEVAISAEHLGRIVEEWGLPKSVPIDPAEKEDAGSTG